MIKNIIKKRKFDLTADRLGRDCPFTHWNLYFKSRMLKLCKYKFKKFDNNSEFRPGAFAVACSKISIGKNVVIRPNTLLFADPREETENGQIVIEDNVLIGSGCHIYVNNHRFNLNDKDIIEQGHYESKNTYLKKGCWLGANVIVLPGITIGNNSVIGAGSIVTQNIPDRVVAVGNPARIVKSLL